MRGALKHLRRTEARTEAKDRSRQVTETGLRRPLPGLALQARSTGILRTLNHLPNDE
jgi:hypothetical protein